MQDKTPYVDFWDITRPVEEQAVEECTVAVDEVICRADIHKDICNNLNKIYIAKNHDYGNSFAEIRKDIGDVAIVLRIADKFYRLKQLLLNGNQQVKDETIEDTLTDLANYSIMELVERKIDRDNQ